MSDSITKRDTIRGINGVVVTWVIAIAKAIKTS